MPLLTSFFSKRYTALAVLALLVAGSSIYGIHRLSRPGDIVRLCSEDSNKPLCYSQKIEAVLRVRGIPAAFDALAAAYDTDPEFAGTCHAVTHELGKAAYDEFHKTGKTELTSKASYCGFGFYHGFMDALFVDTNDLAEARNFCTYIGQNVPHPPPAQFAEGSCYHGIGHGITDGTDPRAWGSELAIVRPGLVLCHKVADGNDVWESRCASGVFNALGNMYNEPKYKLHPDSDPYALCRKGNFSDVDAQACYSQMNTQAVALGHDNLAEIIAFTSKISNETYRSEALTEASSYYVQILKRAQKNLTVDDLNRCDLSKTDMKKSCVRGLIGGIYEFGTPDRQYEEAMRVCASTELDTELRGDCFAVTFEFGKYYFSADVVSRMCAQIPAEYKILCAV